MDRSLTALSLVLALGFGACSDDEPAGGPADTGDAEADAAEPFRVALVFDLGGRGDLSFNDMAAAGLDRAIVELGIEASEIEPAEADEEAALREAAADHDLVLAVGFLFSDALGGVAPAFPEVEFALLDGYVEAENVTSVFFAAREGSFVVGAAAALKSQSGTVGFIGGVDIPLIHAFQAGFEAGARHVDEDVEVLVRYLSAPPAFGGFNDPAAARTQADAMYELGADVIFHAAGGSGVGLFEAAAGRDGVWAIGVDSDQYLSASEAHRSVILTSMMKRLDNAVFTLIQEAQAGDLASGARTLDLASGGVGYATSGGFVDDIADQLDALVQQIIDGTIIVPDTPSPDRTP